MHAARDRHPDLRTVLPFFGRLPRHAVPILCVLALAWLVQALAQPMASPAAPGAPRYRVADRDRCRVYELDADLLLAGRREAGWPLQMAARSDGGLWLARSGNATPDFGARLDLVGRDGAVRGQLWLEAHLDLAAGPDNAAWCIERVDAQTRRLLRVDDDVVPRTLLVDGHLALVRTGREAVWCSTDDGRLLQLSTTDGSLTGSSLVPGGVHDLQPDGAGGCWLLAGSSPRRLLRLRPDFGMQVQFDLPGTPDVLAHDCRSGGQGAPAMLWLLDTRARCLLRFEDGGTGVSSLPLPVVEPRLLLATPEGGVLLASPGAILRYDRNAQLLPGQGGFGWISSLTLVGG